MTDNEPTPPVPAAGPLDPDPAPASPWAAERSRFDTEPAAPRGRSAPSPVPTWFQEPSPFPAGDPSVGQASHLSADTVATQQLTQPRPPTGWTQEPAWDGEADRTQELYRPQRVQPDTLGRPPAGRRGRGGLVVLMVALALVAGLVGGVLGSVVTNDTDLGRLLAGGDDEATDGVEGSTAGDGSAAARGDDAGVADPPPQGETGSVAEIAARVLPSVVSIRVTTATGAGSGSGFVVDEEGLIVTNNHVIAAGGSQPADDIVVELADGSQAEAEVVGTEASYDIAVLRIDPAEVGSPLVALPFGDSDRVVVGEQVVAVGAPLGLDSTVTTGIVSALNRPVSAGDAQQTAFINAIQTDAAINPGNSGGPLVNLRGEVVGVNSAIAQAPGGQAGGSIGLGFSIPSNQAARTAGQLVDDGFATFPVVGVLLDRTYQGEGVRIVSEEDATDSRPVVPGGPADVAGLRAGDVILAFEGRPVTESDELVVAIRAREPGDEVTLTVRRGEDVFDVDLVLEAGDQG